MSDQPKRRGRPSKPPADRRRNQPSFRCDDTMLAQLRDAAKRHGRTLNEEIVRRIAASFSPDPAPQADPRSVTVSDIRQIVREELRRNSLLHAPGRLGPILARLSDKSAASPMPEQAWGRKHSAPVQIFGRDHLPS